jgi:Flp pilus assembly protein TadD
MNKMQIGVVTGAVVLFAGLYFGFDTKPRVPQRAGMPAETATTATSGASVREKARGRLNPEQTAALVQKESAVQTAKDQSAKLEALKALSGWWYAEGEIPTAGLVAEEVAELDPSDAAWSVAGATFFNGLRQTQDPILRQFCAERAVQAFEKAASINPEQVEHRVNMALVFAENPAPEDPMKAVMMLRDLEKRHPENPAVYNALGRLAIKTGQWSRAVERLEKAWSLDPSNPNTPCLLAKAYEELGEADKAAAFAEKCR